MSSRFRTLPSQLYFSRRNFLHVLYPIVHAKLCVTAHIVRHHNRLQARMSVAAPVYIGNVGKKLARRAVVIHGFAFDELATTLMCCIFGDERNDDLQKTNTAETTAHFSPGGGTDQPWPATAHDRPNGKERHFVPQPHGPDGYPGAARKFSANPVSLGSRRRDNCRVATRGQG